MTDFVAAESGIRQLQARCIDTVWRKDAKGFAECFVEDGEWKIAGQHVRGRAEIEALFAKLLGLCDKVITQNGTPILTVEQGSAFGRTMSIPGMPRFSPGDEVVLILERTASGFALAGLAQGVFRVDRAGTVPIVKRDLAGLELVERKAGALREPLGRTPRLDALLDEIRRLAAEGGAR